MNENLKDYFDQLPEDRKIPMHNLRNLINDSIPKGFQEDVTSGFLWWNIPLETYPSGYHCTPGKPLPFLAIASQKNFIALYHMGLYANKDLYDWFVNEYPKFCKRKLDMGKSCIRFKETDDIPLDLLKLLVSKMSPLDWIHLYEEQLKKRAQ